MENTQPTSQPEGESSILYIIGAVIIVAIIVAGVLLWPKPIQKQQAATATPVVEEKSMITKLTCDKQWYNPMIGFPKYYLSVEGSAMTTAKTVDCVFTITASTDGKTLATEKIPAVMTAAPERGGQTFRCTTKAIELPKGIVVTMMTTVKDDLGSSSTCPAGTMTLP